MRETDTVFLQTVGRFIQAQVQLAVIPLAQTIAEQSAEILRLKEKQDKEFSQLSTAGNVINHRLEKLYNATDDWERVARMIDQALHDLPAPTNGRDGKDGIAGIPGKDGKDATVDYDAINKVISDYIGKQIETLPIPKDGKDGKDAIDGKNGNDGLPGKDGADVVAAFRDSDRHLILTLSNGVTKDIGPIHGIDGKNGEPGKDGKDGRDGFGFDDFGIEYDGEKTFTFYFVRGEEKKKFSFITPLIIYRGIWRQGKYLKGDAATYDGGMFVAKEDTETAPGITGSDWQLATKRGRDGKQGEKGDAGDGGKPGRDGRDLTQMGLDGSKW